jgi:hypothetical protein
MMDNGARRVCVFPATPRAVPVPHIVCPPSQRILFTTRLRPPLASRAASRFLNGPQRWGTRGGLDEGRPRPRLRLLHCARRPDPGAKRAAQEGPLRCGASQAPTPWTFGSPPCPYLPRHGSALACGVSASLGAEKSLTVGRARRCAEAAAVAGAFGDHRDGRPGAGRLLLLQERHRQGPAAAWGSALRAAVYFRAGVYTLLGLVGDWGCA